jgi:gluconolactonase
VQTAILCICLVAASAAFALDFNAPVEKFGGGFQFTEGSIWIAARNEFLFSDIPANRIVRLKDGKFETFRSPSGNSNGLTLDKQGRLIACEHGPRRVTRTETDGTITVLAERYEGKRLNSPNDVVGRL